MLRFICEKITSPLATFAKSFTGIPGQLDVIANAVEKVREEQKKLTAKVDENMTATKNLANDYKGSANSFSGSQGDPGSEFIVDALVVMETRAIGVKFRRRRLSAGGGDSGKGQGGVSAIRGGCWGGREPKLSRRPPRQVSQQEVVCGRLLEETVQGQCPPIKRHKGVVNLGGAAMS